MWLSWTPLNAWFVLCRHEELMEKGGIYSDMWLQQGSEASDVFDNMSKGSSETEFSKGSSETELGTVKTGGSATSAESTVRSSSTEPSGTES